MTSEQKSKFERLASALSPENLCCDGECSKRETKARYNRLTKEWKALEAEAGQKVTEDDVWNWIMGK
jgi:predicted transcriptional regulator